MKILWTYHFSLSIKGLILKKKIMKETKIPYIILYIIKGVLKHDGCIK